MNLRRFVFFVGLFCSLFLLIFFLPPAHAAYLYSRSLTVTSTPSIASGTNINFPLLVSSTLASFESTSTGGRFYNANGYDHAYATSTQNCLLGNFLNYENESYVSSTGALVDWVNVPSLSTSTQIFICYGNPSTTVSQANAAGTWNSNYKAVWHLDDGGTGTTTDSTSNGNSGTQVNGPTSVPGEIGQSTFFSGGSGQYVDFGFPSSLQITNNITISAWFNLLNDETNEPLIFNQYSGSSNCGINLNPNQSFTANTWANTVGNCTSIDGPDFSASSIENGWHYAVVTFSSGSLLTYLDGALANSYSTSVNTIGYSNTGAQHTRIGAVNALNIFGTEDVEEARISDAVSSPSWILTEYNNQSDPSIFYTLGSESSLSPPVINSFSASPVAITSGNSATLSWTTSNATSISIDQGVGTESATSSGSVAVSPTVTTTYTLTATNANGTSTASATVTVIAPAPTAPSIVVDVAAGYNANYIPTTTTTPLTPTSSLATSPASGKSNNSSSLLALQSQLTALETELQHLLVQSQEASSSSFVFSRNLSLWDEGPDVEALQNFLIKANAGPQARLLSAHGATDIFGPLTFAALKEYQASVGLPATGYMGTMTRQEIASQE